jgi:hypothetical protein
MNLRVHPTPSPSTIFTFGFVVESIKELGDVSRSLGNDLDQRKHKNSKNSIA